MLYVYHSNKIEILAHRLSSLIHFEPLAPLKAEQVVVESAAMQHWLTEQVSQISGIAADIQFPFPAALVWQIYRQQMPSLAKHSSFDRSPLVWRLLSLFETPLFTEKYPQFRGSPLEKYLNTLRSQQDRLSFVEQLANLFDQYQIYRPDWLLNWQKGGYIDANTAPWQADLWALLCQLSAETDRQQDRATVFSDAMHLFPLHDNDAKQVAERLHIFALSGLAKTYLDLFSQLASSIDIHVYCLNPCCVYWQDVQSEKQQLRQQRLHSSLTPYCHENEQANNELLALMAKQSRDYIQLLQEQQNVHSEELFVDFVNEEKKSLLHYLQQDMLWLRQKEALDHSEKILVEDQDQSLLFHSCHSPLREVQVLHNQLLDFIAQNPDCKMDTIAIMVPDLETYIPALHAVFSASDSYVFLPYNIAERQFHQEQGIKKSLISLLKLKQGQFKREDILLLLQEPSLARAFGFTNTSLLQQLIEQLQVRFGLKDEVWQNMSDKSMVSFAWQQARQRLLASFVLAENSQSHAALLSGISDDVAHQAGLLCQFIDRLIEMAARAEDHQSLADHSLWLEYLLHTFFKAEEEFEYQQLRQIRETLENMQQHADLAAVDIKLDSEVFVQQFEQQMQLANANHYFKPSVINIATLLPLRSIPFKFIAVLGLNDGEFPRPANTDQLDLMLHSRRAGDRNRREEDRYLFLEVLLACRQQCHLSFIGNSQVDNSERFPSLLISELIKHLQQHYQLKDDRSLSQYLLQQHKLQVFDDAYFSRDHSRLFSYDRHALAQAKALRAANALAISTSENPCFIKTLEQSPAAITVPLSSQLLSVSDFVLCLKKPSLHLLRELGLQEQWQIVAEESVENFSANGLDNFLALQTVFEALQQEQIVDADYLCRQGLLAQASLGEIEFEQIQASAVKLLTLCQANHLSQQQHRMFIDLTLKEYQISGELTRFNKTMNQRIAYVGRKLHGAFIVQAWIEHLLCQLHFDNLNSYLVDEQGVYKLSALDKSEAEGLLVSLLDFYQSSQQQLSWYFPKASWNYCVEMKTSGDEIKALKALNTSLLGSAKFSGEWQQSDNAFVYRGHNQLQYDKIIAQAENVFLPVLDYWQQLESIDDAQLEMLASKEQAR